jgi:hypothetical protein
MPLHEKKPGEPLSGARRLQIIGPPYGMKTTVAGRLAIEGPTTIVGLPGEKHTDILTPQENLRVLLFDPLNTNTDNIQWEKIWDEIRVETRKLVEDKSIQHLVFDGAHKAFDICRQAGNQKYENQGFKAWEYASAEFLKWFQQGIYAKGAEWIIWLAWSAKETVGDDNDKKGKKKTIMPDYMGRMQQTVVGEMNIIYQYVEGGRPVWQLRQTEDAMGIGIRTAPERAEKVPVRIPADWKKLKEILLG